MLDIVSGIDIYYFITIIRCAEAVGYLVITANANFNSGAVAVLVSNSTKNYNYKRMVGCDIKKKRC